MEILRNSIFDMEGNITELSDISAKINAAVDDLSTYYFDALCEEEDSRYHKHFFKGAEIRKNIIADYALQLEENVSVLVGYCGNAIHQVVDIMNVQANNNEER